MNKRLLILFLLVFTVASYAGVKVELSPNPLIIGEPCRLKLIADTGEEYPAFENLPTIDGITWNKNNKSQSSSVSIVNGKYTKSLITIYSFTISKKEVKLPQLVVVHDNKKQYLGSQKLTATKRTIQQRDSEGKVTNVELNDMIFSEVSLINKKKKYFIGEEIEAEINLYYSIKIDPQWPKINLENIIVKDFSSINKHNPQFKSQPSQYQKIKNGKQYNVFTFSTAFRFIAKGKYIFNPDVNCVVNIPNSNNNSRRRDRFGSMFGDDFFGRSRYNRIEHKVKVKPVNIIVSELPILSDKTNFSGLIGNWDISHTISGISKTNNEIKEGDSIELNIKIEGNGVIDNIKAPELKLSKFRAFPAEITKDNQFSGKSSVTIKYILMPEDAGQGDISFSIATFSTNDEKYKTFDFTKKITIKPNKKTESFALTREHSTDETVKIKPLKIKKRSDILYLKKNEYKKISLQLNDKKEISFIIIIGSIILLIFSELIILLFKKTESEVVIRRKNALKNKGKILKALNDVSDDKLADLSHSEILPFLNASFAQPAGTAASELAEKVEDKELSEVLKELDQIGYFATAENKKELKDKMYKLIKKITIVLISFMPFISMADNSETIQEAMTSYDVGEFEKSLELYKSLLDTDNPDPNILYNIGNSFVQLNDEIKALICYEQARRLKPRDRDILENTNLIRRKLDLVEVDKPETPYEYMISFRDNFQPDEWMMFASSLFAAVFTIIIARRFLNKKVKVSLIAIFAISFVLSIIAIYAQKNSTFNENNALIAIDNLEIYTLPSDTANSVEHNIKLGEDVIIEEKRKRWIHITKNNISGWIKIENAYQILAPIKM